MYERRTTFYDQFQSIKSTCISSFTDLAESWFFRRPIHWLLYNSLWH